MVVVYKPMDDTWNKLNIIFPNRKENSGRLVIANDRLFFVQGVYLENIYYEDKSISIIEVKIEERVSIPIVNIYRPSCQ